MSENPEKHVSSAASLIENVIRAMSSGVDPEEELGRDENVRLLAYSGIRKFDVITMADHVVNNLYHGKFPDFQN